MGESLSDVGKKVYLQLVFFISQAGNDLAAENAKKTVKEYFFPRGLAEGPGSLLAQARIF